MQTYLSLWLSVSLCSVSLWLHSYGLSGLLSGCLFKFSSFFIFTVVEDVCKNQRQSKRRCACTESISYREALWRHRGKKREMSKKEGTPPQGGLAVPQWLIIHSRLLVTTLACFLCCALLHLPNNNSKRRSSIRAPHIHFAIGMGILDDQGCQVWQHSSACLSPSLSALLKMASEVFFYTIVNKNWSANLSSVSCRWL